MKTSKTARQWSVKQRMVHIIKKISLCEKERIRGILESRFKKIRDICNACELESFWGLVERSKKCTKE